MSGAESDFWEHVIADGLRVPTDRSLVEMTEDLTRMLGDPDPAVRDAIAFPTIATWISDGVYDELFVGLGDGMCHGLDIGLGESGTDTVFRRSFSALVVAECIERDRRARLTTADVVLRWGDRLMGWFGRERDLRGYVPGKGWAHAIAHGADALTALARSPHLGHLELTVILDVIADRLVSPTTTFLVSGETDRLAHTTMQVLHRDLVPLEVLEPWVARLALASVPARDVVGNPFETTGNVQNFLRSLHLQLGLGPVAPPVRADLLLVLIDHLKATNSGYFVTPDHS